MSEKKSVRMVALSWKTPRVYFKFKIICKFPKLHGRCSVHPWTGHYLLSNALQSIEMQIATYFPYGDKNERGIGPCARSRL